MRHIKHGSVQSGAKCLLLLLLFGIFIIFLFLDSIKTYYNVTTTKNYTSIDSNETKLHGKLLQQATEINIEQNNTNYQQKLCPLPKLNPFSPEMMSLLDETVMRFNYSCWNNPIPEIFKDVAFHVEKGNHLIRDVKIPDGVKCCYKRVERVDDELIRIATECQHIINETTEIPSSIDLIAVNCTTAANKIYLIDGFQILHEKPEAENRVRAYHQKIGVNNSANADETTLSVIIVGLDTTSQMHFERSMPLSKTYLDTNLSGIRLMGYNKVADNTLPNLFPLLTGQFWDELQKSCFFMDKTDNRWDLSNCTYIWDNFAENGYRISFFEDEIPIGIFNLYFHNAFKNKIPTDYYWRAYGILMEKYFHSIGFCYGPRLHLQSLLDNVLATAEFFRNRRHFNFVFSTHLSHDNPNYLAWGDKPVLEFLKNMQSKNLLNDTALFLLGDHGIRSRDDMEQAMIENRQPLAYIVLPSWFSERFPVAFANVEWNAKNSVLSPFDLYKTFFDFMDLPRLNGENWRPNVKLGHIEKHTKIMERGRSIFEISPNGRNCETAGIPNMWCLCHTRVPLQNDSYLAVLAAQTAIAAVNQIVKNFADCEFLKVKEILNASVMIPNVETFYKNPGCFLTITEGNKTFNGLLHEMMKMGVKTIQDGNTCDEDIFIEVMFLGYPLDPVFKTMVLRNTSEAFSAPYQVIRSDWYSDKGHCVENGFRPYCICKPGATRKPVSTEKP